MYQAWKLGLIWVLEHEEQTSRQMKREELCRKREHYTQTWVEGKASSNGPLFLWPGEQPQGLS